MNELSVVVITRNEEANLPRCLDAVRWADEIIVVDSHSSDTTVEIAIEHGARVIDHNWSGFGPAKQVGVDAASGPWILSVDADEEVTPELAAEIQSHIASSDAAVGYYIPRRTNFLGRWIGHCGWYPDYVLRLFRKEKGRFDGAVIHERVVVDGSTERLKHDLLHYCYPDMESYLAKSNKYTTIGAEQAFASGKRTGLFDLTLRPAVSFFSHYLVRQGFRDGLEGLMISALSASAVFVKYAKLRKLSNTEENHRDVIHDRAKTN
jgi:glycosyltransferase involved in cell wall biosynthesis